MRELSIMVSHSIAKNPCMLRARWVIQRLHQPVRAAQQVGGACVITSICRSSNHSHPMDPALRPLIAL
jgi:hypothetical protein